MMVIQSKPAIRDLSPDGKPEIETSLHSINYVILELRLHQTDNLWISQVLHPYLCSLETEEIGKSSLTYETTLISPCLKPKKGMSWQEQDRSRQAGISSRKMLPLNQDLFKILTTTAVHGLTSCLHHDFRFSVSFSIWEEGWEEWQFWVLPTWVLKLVSWQL